MVGADTNPFVDSRSFRFRSLALTMARAWAGVSFRCFRTLLPRLPQALNWERVYVFIHRLLRTMQPLSLATDTGTNQSAGCCPRYSRAAFIAATFDAWTLTFTVPCRTWYFVFMPKSYHIPDTIQALFSEPGLSACLVMKFS